MSPLTHPHQQRSLRLCAQICAGYVCVYFSFTHVPDSIPTSNHVPSGCRCNTVWSIRCYRHCHPGADKVESGWTRSHPNSQKIVDCAASSVATAQSVCNVSTECGVRVTQGCYVGARCFTQSGGNLCSLTSAPAEISLDLSLSKLEPVHLNINSVCTLSMHFAALNTYAQQYITWQLLVIWALRPALLHQQSA